MAQLTEGEEHGIVPDVELPAQSKTSTPNVSSLRG